MGGQFDIFCKVLKEVQADISCGQEHNLDTTKSQVRSILYHTAQQHWSRTRINFGTTPMEFQRLYKPGGTFMITIGDATGRMRDRYVDKWGRWVSQSFLGRAGRIVTIVSAYQVVTDTPVMGGTTVAAQQYSLLVHTQDSVTHPRRAFRRDLKDYLLSCKTAGHELLVMGDFNEEIGQEADGMIDVMQSVGLIDLMRQRHPLRLPATYARGQKCLDYVMGTPIVAAAVRKAGYEPFNARYTTDHRPYFIDFSITELFGLHIQPLSRMEPRILKSNNIHQVTAYVRKKYELLERHNVFRRIDRLLLPGNRHSFAERLDNDVVAASLAAEKTIQKYGEPQWSVELHHERKKVQIIKKCLSMAKTRLVDNEQAIRTEWRKLNGTMEPPVNEHECLKYLRQSESRVKELVNASFEQREQERLKRIHVLEQSTKQSDKLRAKTLKQLHVAEAKNRLYAKLRAMRMVNERSGVSRIEIPLHPEQDPKACSEWQQIDVPTEVLEHLRLRNQKHFGQAAGTPFTTPPLSNHLGYCGDGPFASHILEGKYPYLSDLEANLKTLVHHLKITNELAQLRVFPTIDENDYVAKLKVHMERIDSHVAISDAFGTL